MSKEWAAFDKSLVLGARVRLTITFILGRGVSQFADVICYSAHDAGRTRAENNGYWIKALRWKEAPHARLKVSYYLLYYIPVRFFVDIFAERQGRMLDSGRACIDFHFRLLIMKDDENRSSDM